MNESIRRGHLLRVIGLEETFQVELIYHFPRVVVRYYVEPLAASLSPRVVEKPFSKYETLCPDR